MVWHGWEVNGVRGQGNLPPIAGQFSGPLIVCGAGRSLWDDLANLPVQSSADILCINLTGVVFPRRFLHWASMHGDHFPHWLGLRALDLPEDGHIHTHSMRSGSEFFWDFENPGGCSGIFAALVGLALGYEHIVLCGCPENSDGHFYDPPGSSGTYTNSRPELDDRYF